MAGETLKMFPRQHIQALVGAPALTRLPLSTAIWIVIGWGRVPHLQRVASIISPCNHNHGQGWTRFLILRRFGGIPGDVWDGGIGFQSQRD